MKNRIKGMIILILSLLSLLFSYRSFFQYYNVFMGNRLSLEGKYNQGDEYYFKALEWKDNSLIRENILKNTYEEKNYEEFLKEESNLNFLRGNSKVKIAEELKDTKKSKEEYEGALEEYKKALLTEDDINIKKNYEIVQKRIEEQEQKEQEQKEQKEEEQKQQQDQEKDQQKQDEQQRSQDNQNHDKKDKREQNQQNSSGNKEEQRNSENQNEEKKSQEQGKNQEEVQKLPDRKQEELQYMLQKLENNEKQSFKNNERFINQNIPSDNNKW